MLYYLDDDGRDDCDDLPAWALGQTRADGQPTGQVLPALFEDLLGLDPSGNDRADIVPLLPGPWTKQPRQSTGEDPTWRSDACPHLRNPCHIFGLACTSLTGGA
jgi:hypothetical protein